MSDKLSVSNPVDPVGGGYPCSIPAAVAVLTATPWSAAAYIHFSSNLPRILTVEDYQPAVIVASTVDERVGNCNRASQVAAQSNARLLVEAFLAAEDKRFFSHEGSICAQP